MVTGLVVTRVERRYAESKYTARRHPRRVRQCAALPFRECPCDVEPKTRPANIRRGGWRSVEGLEDSLSLGGRNAETSISNLEHQGLAFPLRRENDWRTGWRISRRVLDEVRENAKRLDEIEASRQ